MIFTWLYKWGAIIGGALATALALIFYGRREGEKSEQAKDDAREGKALDAVVNARSDAERHVDSLPKGPDPVPTVGPVLPAGGGRTAANELRNDWSRD